MVVLLSFCYRTLLTQHYQEKQMKLSRFEVCSICLVLFDFLYVVISIKQRMNPPDRTSLVPERSDTTEKCLEAGSQPITALTYLWENIASV